MAQPIYCDMQGCTDPDAPHALVAEWMVQRLDGTLVEAWCALHWPIAAVVYADAAAQANGSSLAELLSPPEPGPDDPTDSDEPDAAGVASFQDAPPAAEAAQEPGQAPGDGETPEAPVPAALEPEQPVKVIRRGTSPSRRAHEARKRERSHKVAMVTVEQAPEPGEPVAEGD